MAVVPEELWGKREAAEVSMRFRGPLVPVGAGGKGVGILEAADLLENVLRHAPDERIVSSGVGAEVETETASP